MKNYQYLTTELLDTYLKCVVSDSERNEVAELIATDPETAQQLDEFEWELEQYALQHAVPPPPATKTALFDQLFGSEIKKREPDQQTHYTYQPPKSEPAPSSYIDVEVSNTHIRVHKYWRTAFIAIFILSKVFLILGLYYYFKANSLEQEVNRLNASTQATAPVPRGQSR